MNLAENVNNITGEIVITVILIVLAFSTIVDLLCNIGLLPWKVRYFFKKGDFDIVFKVLEDMGIKVKEQRRINFLHSRSWHIIHNRKSRDIIRNDIESLVENRKKKNVVYVGQEDRISKLRGYYDLMGALCNSKTCERVAKYLNTVVHDLVSEKKIEPFDFIVTPKLGSPMLGYEFSKLQDIPFVMHESKPRYMIEGNTEEFEATFCCEKKPESGKRALIVDDSMTSGGLIGKAISDLKKYNYCVSDCVIVFNVADGGGIEYLRDEMNVNTRYILEVKRAEIKNAKHRSIE